MSADQAVEPKTYHYDDFTEGQTFESTMDITPELAASIVRILAYVSPVVTDERHAILRGYRSCPIPPAYAAAFQFVASAPGVRMPPGGVYTKQELRMQAPFYVGDTLHTTMTVKAKYERRGRKNVEFHNQTVNQHGAPVLWGRRVGIWAS